MKKPYLNRVSDMLEAGLAANVTQMFLGNQVTRFTDLFPAGSPVCSNMKNK